MKNFYIYSLRCIADESIAPFIRGKATKTYLRFSDNLNDIDLHINSLPEYESCFEQKVYLYDFDANIGVSPEEIALGYSTCKVCTLSNHRNQTVHYRGFGHFSHVKVVFVGMGPGRDEDDQGAPFVGSSGLMIDTLFNEAQFIEERLLLNLVACRPQDGEGSPKRDDPSIEECAACSLRLWMTLRYIKPNVVIALGRQAAQMFWENPKSFSINRLYQLEKHRLFIGQMRHPVYLLRDMAGGGAQEKQEAVSFLKKLSNFANFIPPYLPYDTWGLTGISDRFPFKFLEKVVPNASIPKPKKREKKV